MKNKILALLATIGLASSVTAVEINDNLSINGFIDGSYSNEDLGAGAQSQDLGIDEVELNFLVNVGNISGVINLDSDSNTDDADFDIEQAHITYSLDNGVSFTFGRYGSALGLEGEDPAGLYTYSRAYDDGGLNGSAFNFANIDGVPGSVEGLTVSYAADLFSVAASFENPTGTETALETNDLNVELSLQYTGIENTVIGAGFFFDNTAANLAESDFVNVYFTTSFGKLLVGAEYSEISTDGKNFANTATNDDDRDAYMVLLDYDFNDKLGAALRFSSNETPNDQGDFDRMTIAPNYQITESLGAIVEFSDIDDRGNDGEEYAVELTYTF